MRKTWLTTDTHINHEYLVKKGLRPKDAQDRMFENWNRYIGEGDIVLHLGDVIFSRPSELGRMMPFLPGRKILVRGNHDAENMGWYMNRGFAFACDGFLHEGIWFSHEPAPFLPPGARLNVHGHLHSNGHRESEYRKEPWHLKLALEETDYMPVELWEWVRENCPHIYPVFHEASGTVNCSVCKKQNIPTSES